MHITLDSSQFKLLQILDIFLHYWKLYNISRQNYELHRYTHIILYKAEELATGCHLVLLQTEEKGSLHTHMQDIRAVNLQSAIVYGVSANIDLNIKHRHVFIYSKEVCSCQPILVALLCLWKPESLIVSFV